MCNGGANDFFVGRCSPRIIKPDPIIIRGSLFLHLIHVKLHYSLKHTIMRVILFTVAMHRYAFDCNCLAVINYSTLSNRMHHLILDDVELTIASVVCFEIVHSNMPN